MRSGALIPLLTLALAACPPPDPVDGPSQTGKPGIAIAYPPWQTEDQIMLDPDGALSFVLVVDVENFELLEPGTIQEVVEGQGHWHMFGPNDFYAPTSAAYYEGRIENVTPGIVILSAQLVQNTHTALDPTQCDPCEAVVEFTAVPFDDTTDTDSGS